VLSPRRNKENGAACAFSVAHRVTIAGRPDLPLRRHSASVRTQAFARLLFFGSYLVFALSIFSMIAAVLSGPGTRLGWWQYSTGVMMLVWSAYAGCAVAFTCVAVLLTARPAYKRNGLPLLAAGALIGFLVAAVPGTWHMLIRDLPRTHDFSTDRKNPPAFKAMLLVRKRARSSVPVNRAISGNRLLATPGGLRPYISESSRRVTYERSLAAARKMEWLIVDANPEEGRIEALATTWFGLKEDLVIRIRPARNGSRVDIRSVSRSRTGDGRTNAARIRSYLKELSRTGA
jgi:hypothetical protein